ncbi:MAG: peroxiredoxin [Sulfurimonas sp.]|jgi:peroxiredoxin
MKTLKEQTQAQVAKTKKVKPEYIQELDDVMDSARKFKQGADAIKVGELAPDFTLPNANKKMITLSKLLINTPVIISFYRGDWCPYCSLELKALQARLADIKALGAELVTISPQMPDESLSKEDIEALDFLVLSDQDANVAAKYGVAWDVPEFILEHMKRDRDLDLADINNGNGNILPIPATFVVDKNGIVVWQYADVDFRTRAEPEDIISALKQL